MTNLSRRLQPVKAGSHTVLLLLIYSFFTSYISNANEFISQSFFKPQLDTNEVDNLISFSGNRNDLINTASNLNENIDRYLSTKLHLAGVLTNVVSAYSVTYYKAGDFGDSQLHIFALELNSHDWILINSSAKGSEFVFWKKSSSDFLKIFEIDVDTFFHSPEKSSPTVIKKRDHIRYGRIDRFKDGRVDSRYCTAFDYNVGVITTIGDYANSFKHVLALSGIKDQEEGMRYKAYVNQNRKGRSSDLSESFEQRSEFPPKSTDNL